MNLYEVVLLEILICVLRKQEDKFVTYYRSKQGGPWSKKYVIN